MGFAQSIKVCLTKYFVFSGRSSRPEYWWFVLFVILTSVVLAILGSVIFETNPDTGESSNFLNSVFQLAIVIPMLAAGWRRLHDTGRPGWYLFLPMTLGVVTMFMMLSGVAVFSFLESGTANPEALRGPAAILGTTGLVVVSILQLVLSVLMIWWLSRPSEDGPNHYGPPVS